MAKWRDEEGLTLLELMIGVGIGITSMMAFTTLLSLQTNTNLKLQGRNDFTDLANLVRISLASSASCTNAFTSALPAGGTYPVTPGKSYNIGTGNPLLVSNHLLTSSSKYGSVTLNKLVINKIVQPPNSCAGCELHRSFDLTLQGSTGNFINQTMKSDPNLNTSMTILAQVDNSGNFLQCLDTSYLQTQQACEAMGLTWSNGTTCLSSTPVMNIQQQQQIVVDPQSHGKILPKYSLPPKQYELCYLTGIAGGGENAFEGVQIQGNCASGWDIYAWNNEPLGGKIFYYDWACIQQANCSSNVPATQTIPSGPGPTPTPTPPPATPPPTPTPSCIPSGQLCGWSCVGAAGCSGVINFHSCNPTTCCSKAAQTIPFCCVSPPWTVDSKSPPGWSAPINCM